MNKRNPSHKRWLILAISGLLLTDFGLLLFGGAVIERYRLLQQAEQKEN